MIFSRSLRGSLQGARGHRHASGMAGESTTARASVAEADCDKPACAVRGEMFAMMKDAAKQNPRRGEGADATTATAEKPCPVDREELGQGTWALLHTMAAHYPDRPDALHRVQARRFFDALGLLYPCAPCASDFREDMRRTPPAVESRESLAVWLCNRHNEVNEKLGKPLFPCVLKDLDERWRKGANTAGMDDAKCAKSRRRRHRKGRLLMINNSAHIGPTLQPSPSAPSCLSSGSATSPERPLAVFAAPVPPLVKWREVNLPASVK